jgi:hypothetical protein
MNEKGDARVYIQLEALGPLGTVGRRLGAHEPKFAWANQYMWTSLHTVSLYEAVGTKIMKSQLLAI